QPPLRVSKWDPGLPRVSKWDPGLPRVIHVAADVAVGLIA
ncbi:hypothetical protein Tco_1552990, partial [Tanacetum coccineum]